MICQGAGEWVDTGIKGENGGFFIRNNTGFSEWYFLVIWIWSFDIKRSVFGGIKRDTGAGSATISRGRNLSSVK